MKQCIVLFFLFFLHSFHGFAIEFNASLQDNQHNSFSLSSVLYQLTDTHSSITFDKALKSKQFKPHGKAIVPNMGFTQYNYWFKFIISNQTNAQGRVLEFAYPFFNQLDVYLPDDLGNYTKTTVGDHFVFSDRPIQHKNFLFDLYFKAGETKVIYAYLHCNGEATSFPVNVWTKHDFLHKSDEENLSLGLYYGIVLFVFFFSAFLLFIVREPYQRFYFLYILGVAVFQFALDGMAFEYLWPNNTWLANHIIPLSGSFTLMALILFVVALLQTKTHTPLIHRILWVLLLLDVLFFAMSFFPPPTYSFALMGINFIAVPINLLILIAAVLSYRRGNPTAKYFLIAFSLLILGIIAALLKNFGLLPRVFITEYSIHIGSAIELIMLSFALAENLKLLKQEKEKAQALLLEELKEKSRLQEIANLELERKVNERTLEIQLQKAVIEEKNNDITASINYAQKIQSAILPREEELKAAFNDYFVLYQPRDIISGDFYWLSKKDHLTLITAADCTGHGVPGALMSMLGNSFLNEIVNENDIYNPADILDLLRNRIIQTLKQRETNTKDGMDMALCVIDEKKKQITFAGAYNPVYITKPETAHTAHEFEVYRNQVSSSVELISLPADRFPVGMLEEKTNIKFSEKLYHYQQGDCLYLFSDGLTDQFGGADGKKYRSKRLKDLLLHVFHSDMQSQKDTISSDFLAWKDQLDQVDDVLLVGIRLQ